MLRFEVIGTGPQFSKVRYSNLYSGIDLISYSRDG
jgi:hypothetical protein